MSRMTFYSSLCCVRSCSSTRTAYVCTAPAHGPQRALPGPSQLLSSPRPPCSGQSDWGSCAPAPGPGSHPFFPQSPHQVGCRTGLQPMPCLLPLPLHPPPAQRSRFWPQDQIFHVSLESPEDQLHVPDSVTGPCSWSLMPTTSRIRTAPGMAPGARTGPAQRPSLHLLCPPRLASGPCRLFSSPQGQELPELQLVFQCHSTPTTRLERRPDVGADEAGAPECSRKAGTLGHRVVCTRGRGSQD